MKYEHKGYFINANDSRFLRNSRLIKAGKTQVFKRPSRRIPARGRLRLGRAKSEISAKLRTGEAPLSTSMAMMASAVQEKFMRDLNLYPKKPLLRGRHRLTLAQKLDIEAKPPRRLNKAEWRAIKQKEQFKQQVLNDICPICHQGWKSKRTVLSSCGHMFHEYCLKAFEKYSGTRCCPMCRFKDYEKVCVHNSTADYYKTQMALRLQCNWRGYLARKQLTHLKRTVVPKDPNKRQEFYFDRFEEMNDQIVESMQKQNENVDAVLREIDESIRMSKAVFKVASNDMIEEDEDWRHIKIKALERCNWEEECPICMTDLALETKTFERGELPSRCVTLLNCTHMFHTECLMNFEKFTTNRRVGCPLCRSVYKRRDFHEVI